MDICESFLNAYRDLEEVLAVKYGQRAGTVQLFASGEGARYFEELNLFREMRNHFSHFFKRFSFYFQCVIYHFTPHFSR